MDRRIMRDTILQSIDNKDKEKHDLERRHEELSSAYHRYQKAYDEFRDKKDSYTHSATGLQLGISEILRAERAIGQQVEVCSSSPEVDRLVGLFQQQIDDINDKLMKMELEEAKGDLVQEDMQDELRKLTGRIEDLDDNIAYLINRLFHDAVDLSERN